MALGCKINVIIHLTISNNSIQFNSVPFLVSFFANSNEPQTANTNKYIH
jgi:hypothetical protein